MNIRTPHLVIALAVILMAPDVFAGPSTIEKSEAVIGKLAPNYRLTNQEGQFVALYSLKGKYLLISFIYTECPGPCIAITQSMANLFEQMDPEIAERTQRLTITIDNATDSSAKLKEYGLEFTDNFDNWIFARTDDETLARLSTDLGFYFEQKEKGWFEHMNRLTLLGPDMRLLTHFYGTEFDPVDVGGAIRDSMEGRSVKTKLKDTLDYALVFCSEYDPVSGTYKIDYKFLFVIIFQDLIALATAAYFLRHKISRIFSRISQILKGRKESGS
ncbi:MAG: SCO family protein [Nitrospinota bacterium]|nr:SCO family protein [Nitrospinota bacterium]